jgi:hypothetical protein
MAEASSVLGTESIDMIAFVSPFCPPFLEVAEHDMMGKSKNHKKCKPSGVTKVSALKRRFSRKTAAGFPRICKFLLTELGFGPPKPRNARQTFCMSDTGNG